MRQRLVVLVLVLGMVSLGPVWAGEIVSPASQQSWFTSIWEGVVSFFSGGEKDGGIDPNHEISIPPGESSEGPDFDHGPGLEPGGLLEEPDPNPELDHGPVADPGG